MVLSSSPTSVLSHDLCYVGSSTKHSNHEHQQDSTQNDVRFSTINLKEFIKALPPILRKQKKDNERKPLHERMKQEDERGTGHDPVNQLFSRLDLDSEDWRQYALFESMKNYTRNLIATDDETFTLLLLCWNPNKESPIHDHPCDGCWMRVCEGSVQETRYEINGETDCLEMTSDKVFENGALAFINDNMGYHKVGNPSKSKPAITMHLYCPPFKKCKIWLDPNHASRPANAYMCNYSEYGDKDMCKKFAVTFI